MSYMSTQYDLELTQTGGLPYRLYLYTDAWITPPSSSRAACTPVLFLPGNQGSYKQVRTIGSWLASNPSIVKEGQCYTTYTVDFLEQWSVVSERVIQDQSQFVQGAMEHIKNVHDSGELILVGHSMGSVVARLALKDRTDRAGVTLVSLAAPLDKSPLSLDNRFSLDYSFPNVNSCSFCSGSADVQIVPFPSTADGRRRNTETIPMVWSSPDHQGIVWAHQVIEHLGRLIHSIS